jgi:hypothetical protein
MKNPPLIFQTVRQIALALPAVEESTSYGTPAFKTRGRLFVRLHQDYESLIIRMPPDERQELMDADPGTYFITDHYLNYPWVLIRLAKVHPDALRELLQRAWRHAAPPKAVRKRARRPAKKVSRR